MNRNDKDCVEVTPMVSKRRANIRKDAELLKEITQTSNQRFDELAARLFDWMDRRDVEFDNLRQRYEFMTAEIKSLRLAVEQNTAAYTTLVEHARQLAEQNDNHEQRRQEHNQSEQCQGAQPTGTAEVFSRPDGDTENRK
jgi:hypothetical protein